MMAEELVDLIADSIYRNLRDHRLVIAVGDFNQLSEKQKHMYFDMAHNIIAIVDDYYDAELDEDEFDDEDDEPECDSMFWEG